MLKVPPLAPSNDVPVPRTENPLSERVPPWMSTAVSLPPKIVVVSEPTPTSETSEKAPTSTFP